MKKIELKIKLLSDTCISNGQSFGTLIDSDICTNQFGFPYIPAKRIKGILREAFEDYLYLTCDATKNSLDRLFGTEGDKQGTLKFTDAHLKDCINFIEKNKYYTNDELISFQTDYKFKIKSLYTTTRIQTAIDDRTGVAKEGSLRSIYVINKGLEFYFNIYTNEEYLDQLVNSFKLVHHIGLRRNRGFGEIEVSKLNISDIDVSAFIKKVNNTFENLDEDTYVNLKVNFTNVQPLIISNNDKNKTINYIPGSNIYGYFASNYQNKYKDIENQVYDDNYIKLFFKDGDLKFTNAYIMNNDNETIPVPHFIKKVKHDNVFINTLITSEENNNEPTKKLSSLQGYFCNLNDLNNNNISIATINFNHCYHHKRYKEKYKIDSENIGNVEELYEYFAISENQNFSCNIHGKIKDLKAILVSPYLYIGKDKNSEYGLCKITNIDVEKTIQKINVNKFVLYFKSDAILVNENGNYALTIQEVQNSISKNLGLDMVKIVKYSINFSRSGGYNAKWNLNKPQKAVIEMGSYIFFESDKMLPSQGFLGLENNLGYGEFIIFDINSINTKIVNKIQIETNVKKDLINHFDLFQKLQSLTIIDNKINDLYEKKNYEKFSGINNSQLNNIMLILLKTHNLVEFQNEIKNIIPNNKINQILFNLSNKLPFEDNAKFNKIFDDNSQSKDKIKLLNDSLVKRKTILINWNKIKQDINKKILLKDNENIEKIINKFYFNIKNTKNLKNKLDIFKDEIRNCKIKYKFIEFDIDYIKEMEKYIRINFKKQNKQFKYEFFDYFTSLKKKLNLELIDDVDKLLIELKNIETSDQTLLNEINNFISDISNLIPEFTLDELNNIISNITDKSIKNTLNNEIKLINMFDQREKNIISLYKNIYEQCIEINKIENLDKKLYVKYFKTFIKLIEWRCNYVKQNRS